MRIATLLLAVPYCAVYAQSAIPGSIQGTVTDELNRPVGEAFVTVTRMFASAKDAVTPYSQFVKTGSDGTFLVAGLNPGTYSYCVQ